MTCRSIRLIPACAGKTPRPRRNQFCQQAHPRVCGENVIAGFIAAVRAGSSPRVRGKRVLLPGGGSWARLIPACAGKTGPRREYLTSFGAHPRVCGENVGDRARLCGVLGSSPRVRGKQGHSGNERSDPGLIPACAGKTPRAPCPGYPDRAHPRACGENVVCSAMSFGFPGSSPRVRGKPHRQRQPPDEAGLIPARAGKTRARAAAMAVVPAHPRACGENRRTRTDPPPRPGSSPRVRGKQDRRHHPLQPRGLIPACAGKTRRSLFKPQSSRAHPRVCGENWCFEHAGETVPGSSPRVRGKLCWRSLLLLRGGLIPACAGKTLVRICIPSIWGLIPACAGKTRAPTRAPGGRGAHPRACGENRSTALLCRPASGSSPRVRGKPRAGLQEAARRGLIPACAGKTPFPPPRCRGSWAHPRVCGENIRLRFGCE